MKTLKIPANGIPEATEIGEGLTDLQEAVDGSFELVPIGADHVAMIDEEGKLNGAETNHVASAILQERLLAGDWVAGDCFILGIEGAELTDADPRLLEAASLFELSNIGIDQITRTFAGVLNWRATDKGET